MLLCVQVTQCAMLQQDDGDATSSMSYTNITLGSHQYMLQTRTLKHYGLSDTFDRSIAFLLQVSAVVSTVIANISISTGSASHLAGCYRIFLLPRRRRSARSWSDWHRRLLSHAHMCRRSRRSCSAQATAAYQAEVIK